MTEDIVPVGPGSDPNDYRYFFISYTLGCGNGNIIIRQLKQTDGTPDNGLNIASATSFLMERYQCPIILISWNETTATRYDQWIAFISGAPKKFKFFKLAPTELKVHDGGNEKGSEQNNAPILHIVKPKED